MDSGNAHSTLEQSLHAALETYSNVHRGSGQYSTVTTALYERAREVVLEFLGLDSAKHVVIFCTPRRSAMLISGLEEGSYRSVSSRDFGLPLGVTALAVRKNSLPRGIPFHTGGGTARLISREWVVWAGAPDKFEAGTPAIINVIALACALQLIRRYGNDIFLEPPADELSMSGLLHRDGLEGYSGRELLRELRRTVIGKNFHVPTLEGAKPYVNLDNSASTPALEPVWDVFRSVLRQPEVIRQSVVAETRSICAGMLNAPEDRYQVIFTSNATEALNLAAENLKLEAGPGSEGVILSTLLEHSSNDLPWRMIPGISVVRLAPDQGGFLDLDEMEGLMKAYNEEARYGNLRIRMVAVCGASNVLGSCNDLAGISKIVHRYGARLLVDGAQLVAHRKVDLEGCGIDYFAFSAHKAYAPFGCGVLVARNGLPGFSPVEMKIVRSSGEENAAGIAALGKALLLMQKVGMEVIEEEERILTARLLRGMANISGIKIYGVADPESASFLHRIGVVVFSVKGMMPDKISRELACRGGIGTRYGCHCAHILVKHVLGVPPGLERFQRLMLNVFPGMKFPGVARVSLGIQSTEEDVDLLISTLAGIRRRSSKPGYKKQLEAFVSECTSKVYGGR